MKFALNVLGLTNLHGGDFAGVLDAARLADARGIEQISLGEHLALLPDGFASYPRGRFAYPIDFPYYEPLVALAAIAGVTHRIRLSTNVLVAPLRPALLLAKQIATLDLVSRGRVEIALGAGWHREEFEAAEMNFDARFRYMDEQVRACRAIWSGNPSTFEGARVRFTNLHMHPPPPQGARLPVWLGVDATPRNLRRLVELADGWAAPPETPEKLAGGIGRLKAALAASGRDASTFPVRTTLKPAKHADGSIDWDATTREAVAYRDIGVTALAVIAIHYCASAAELPMLMDRLLALRASL